MKRSFYQETTSGKGYFFVLLAALLWGISGSVAKLLFAEGVTPFQLVQLRLTIATVCLFVWLGIRDPKSLLISRKDILYFVFFGAAGMASVQFTYLFAISKINVAAAILLQYMAPAFIAFHAIMFMGDKLRPLTLMALIGTFLGCYLVVGAYSLDLLKLNVAGIVSGLLSAVGFAWYSIQGEYGMRRYDPWTVLFYALFFATVLWNLVYPPFSAFLVPYPAASWGWIIYIGVMGTLLPFGFYLEGINLVRSTHASITATLEPITAGLISWVFLGETMDMLQMIGAFLVLGSIILLQFGKSQHENSPAALRADRRS